MKQGPSFTVDRLVVGQMATNCYIVTDRQTDQAIIVDPGDDAQYIADHITGKRVTPIKIVATHGHFDHIMAAWELQHMFGIDFLIHENDVFLVKRMRESALHFLGKHVVERPPDISGYVLPSEGIPLGNSKLSIVHTPGHTPGSLRIGVPRDTWIVGDTIFADGGVGRTDFSYCSRQDLSASINSILTLKPSTALLPGHGDETTVADEKQFHIVA